VINPDDVRKRVAELQREIDEIHFANVKYAMQKHRSDLQREADWKRKQRLEKIVIELADLTCWRKTG